MNYPIEIKLKAVEMYLEEDLGITKIAKLLNLGSIKNGSFMGLTL